MKKPSIWLVMPSAGSGSRFGADIPKQYLPFLDKTVFQYTLSCFLSRNDIKGIVIAHAANDSIIDSFPELQEQHVYCVEGGVERVNSVFNAVEYIRDQLADYTPTDLIAVHDAARPCLANDDINHIFAVAGDAIYGAILAAPIVDTIKSINTPIASGHPQIVATLDRDKAVLALTPQVFNGELLHTALKNVLDNDLAITDDASAIELLGCQVDIVEGRKSNIKITCPEDLALAEFHLGKLLEQEES